ncbi:MAG: hypothetical protein AAGE43_14505, partial [Pseudomonadota bacterium]
MKLIAAILSLFLLFIANPGTADSHEASEEAKGKQEIPEPVSYVSERSGRFNGTTIRYQARAGETFLQDLDGEPTAAIFSFDYVAVDSKSSNRPVTFVWNGGPGSASLWLHMGSLGPKRVVVPTDATHAGAPPYPVIDAPETILDVTDLVFVDPVGTGFSRPLGDHEGKEFWGLMEDAKSMASFIRQWLTDNGRWNSPRFLLGESFGTTRAAAVAELLEDDYMTSLNGIIFVSQALNYAGSTPYVADNLISYVTYLPTMAATALYHGKVDAGGMSIEEWVQASRDFATDELLPALWRGNTLSSEDRARVRDGLARFTGLSPEYIERANLRVNGRRFARELLRAEGKTVGTNDARYVMDPVDDLPAEISSDASSNAISGAYKAALLSYLRDDLGVTWNRTYMAPSHPELSEQWNWNPKGREESWEPRWVDTTPSLVKALEVNPGLQVELAYTSMADPNRWQPLELERRITQNGQEESETLQSFIGPHWGSVTPFAIDAAGAPVPVDPGPPPLLTFGEDPAEDTVFIDAAMQVVAYSALLDPTDGETIDLSPAVRGNSPLGSYESPGYGANPVTGEAYGTNVVLHADYGRVVAEFWADGPDSETPPGHWNTIANSVSDVIAEQPDFDGYRIGGSGDVVDRL